MDFSAYTGQELIQFIREARAEQKKRSDVESIPLTMEGLNQTYLAAQGVVPGAQWRKPKGVHDSYPLGWRVQYRGSLWESLVPFNMTEPGSGSSSWKKVSSPPAP